MVVKVKNYGATSNGGGSSDSGVERPFVVIQSQDSLFARQESEQNISLTCKKIDWVHGQQFISEVAFTPDLEPAGKTQYGSGIAICIILNYVLGISYLGIPSIFYNAGIVLSVVTMIFVFFLTYITVMWVVEVTSQAQRMVKDVDNPFNRSSLMLPLQASTPRQREIKKLELVQIAQLFLGPKFRIIYQLCLFMLMYSGLWAYCSVFVATFSEVAFNKFIWCIIFFMAVLPIAVIELENQTILQALLCGIRLFNISAISIVSFYHFSEIDYSDVPLCTIENFGSAFTTSVFAFLFHFSVPGIWYPLRDKQKSTGFTCFTGLALACFLYLISGVPSAMVFGANTQSSVNLNFQGYAPAPIPTMIKFMPLIDTISVFPLIAITLGNSISYELDISTPAVQFWLGRMLAILPPIALSWWFSSLDVIIHIAGVWGVFIGMVTPAILMWKAKRLNKDCFGNKKPWRPRYLSSFWTSDFMVFFVLGTSCVAVAFVLWAFHDFMQSPLAEAAQ